MESSNQSLMKPIMGTQISAKALLWLILIAYVVFAAITIAHHEPWGDELHSWNIAKASTGFFNLIHNTRYEGHPPVWYIVMWAIAQFTHNFFYVQMFHLVFAVLVVYIILFYSPFSIATKALIPFGYYFLFEYAVISRNYVIGILAGFLICIVITKEFKYKTLLYYALLLVMSNTHLLAMLLAGSLHLYFLLLNIEEKKKRNTIIFHLLMGAIIFLPAIYFIVPPMDSELGVHDWRERWSVGQFAIDIQAPLRAFVPMPAWWKPYSFWNEQFLLNLHERYSFLKVIYPLLALLFIAIGCYLLRKDKKCIILFLANIIVTFVIGNVLSLNTQRYSGFIFIGFMMAYWLYIKNKPSLRNSNLIINSMLLIQMIAGFFMVFKDINMPFSDSYKVADVLKKVPVNGKVVTDYWTAITINAYTDKPDYCIDIQKAVTFDLWQTDITEIRKYPYRFCRGLDNLFKRENINTAYFVATDPPQIIAKTDSRLFSSFNVKLIYKEEGTMAKWSNLYLYQINKL